MDDCFLICLAGTASFRASLFRTSDLSLFWQYHAKWKKDYKESELSLNEEDFIPFKMGTYSEAIEHALNLIPSCQIVMVGHHWIHGGPYFSGPSILDSKAIEILSRFQRIESVQNPKGIMAYKLAKFHFPKVPHIGFFDTTFHSTLPEKAYSYPLPHWITQEGYRKYGFHGLSFQAQLRELQSKIDISNKKIVLSHLGRQSSLAAILNCICIDTTMGFTPMDGLMMSTCCGSVDPGLILKLITEKHLFPSKIEELLERESGILGVSCCSDFLEGVLKEKDVNPKAKLAYEMFLYYLQKHLGGLIAALEGIDILTFSGGIGENIPSVRSDCIQKLSFLGASILPDYNLLTQKQFRCISDEKSSLAIFVLPTNIEREIALQLKEFFI